MAGTEWLILAASLVAAVIVVIVAYKLLKFTIKMAAALLLHALGGLFILLVSNVIFNLGIPYDLPTLLISAIGGVPGAICVAILALLGIFL
ncbi:MAG TPA: pro-sigmaK processing inhibitor BofA family protein [Methanocella sp.]|nr:pro-sigmaK processing inhibitor BofA family protein [Methanocella sp.]